MEKTKLPEVESLIQKDNMKEFVISNLIKDLCSNQESTPFYKGIENYMEEVNKLYRYAKAFNLGQFAFLAIDIQSKKMFFKDNSLEEMTGYKRNYFKKGGLESLLSLLPWDHLMNVVKTVPIIDKKIEELNEKKKIELQINYKHQIIDKQGYKKNVLTQVLKIVGDKKKDVGIILIIHDISHLIRSTQFNLTVYSKKDNQVIELFKNQDFKKLLTGKERNIFELLREGYMEKEIADQLSISISTVKNHKQNVFKKLKVNRTIEALRVLGNGF